MARRKSVRTRRTRPAARSTQRSKPTRRAKPARRRAATTASRRRTGAAARVAAAQIRAAALFEAQIHDVWNQLGHECQQFADGFNTEMGANLLRIQRLPDSIAASLRGGGEV